MTTSPTWTHNTADDSYTLIVGDIHCWVWRTGRRRTWNANVSLHGEVVSVYRLPTAAAAKARCEERIAERQASP